MVGVSISHSYFHPGGAHITWVKIISHVTPALHPGLNNQSSWCSLVSIYWMFDTSDTQWA